MCPHLLHVVGGSMSLLKVLVPMVALAVLGVVAIALADGGGAPTAASAARATNVQLRRGPLGRYLVDGRGRASYLFEKDRGSSSACYGSCASVWPPLIARGRVAHGAGVSAARLGTTRR